MEDSLRTVPCIQCGEQTPAINAATKQRWCDRCFLFLLESPRTKEFGYVPNYPKPIDTNPFNLIEGNENKLY